MEDIKVKIEFDFVKVKDERVEEISSWWQLDARTKPANSRRKQILECRTDQDEWLLVNLPNRELIIPNSGRHRPPRKNKSLVRVASTENTGEAFPCGACGDRFPQKSLLYRHIRIDHRRGKGLFECGLCGKLFGSPFLLKRHAQVLHAGMKQFRCQNCGREFAYSHQLRRHTLRKCADHDRNLSADSRKIVFRQCHHCGKCLKTNNFNNHLNTHLKIKPYRCDTCGRGYARLEKLRIHIQSHTGEKPHECRECGKKFGTGSHLKRHLQVHAAAGKKSRSSYCRKCTMRFITKRDLRLHSCTRRQRTEQGNGLSDRSGRLMNNDQIVVCSDKKLNGMPVVLLERIDQRSRFICKDEGSNK